MRESFQQQFIVVATLGALFLTGTAWARDKRAAEVDQEMDCVINAFNRQEKVAWSDVCYTDDRVDYREQVRMATVAGELDDVEADYDYDRESAYQSSLEYLKNFMATTDDRRVTVEEPWYERAKAAERVVDLPETRRTPSAQAYDYSVFENESGLEADKDIKARIDVGMAYRSDHLDWNIAGNLQGKNPTVFVEYEFDNIRSGVLEANGEIVIKNHFVIDGGASVGKIFSGTNEVSEYDMDDRQALAVRTRNNSDENMVWDLSGALGIRVKTLKDDVLDEFLNLDDLEVTLLAGYSHHEQDLSITDGFTVADNTATPDPGSFPGLDSSYNAEWEGPFLGAKLEGQINRVIASFRVEYHMADYHGWGRLNLRPEFQQPKSFEHFSDANGWILDLNLAYQLTKDFCLDFNGGFQLWKAKEGIDRLYLTDGTIAEERQLNEVNWDSHAFMVGGTYKFD